ncbi:hypothetical protein BS78_06G241200 [Paspalum vaginatum]|nr:hypothetical protein BS78_06G241200 [Paspalum vaginatum]
MDLTEAAVGSQPSLLGDVDAPPPSLEPAFPQIDWDNLQIAESQDDEGRIAMISEDQIYVLLGLRDEEDERAVNGQEAQVRTTHINMNSGDTVVGAAIPVRDHVPDEIVIGYDKDNPSMELGTLYPTMKDFMMALKQFAISEYRFQSPNSAISLGHVALFPQPLDLEQTFHLAVVTSPQHRLS